MASIDLLNIFERLGINTLEDVRRATRDVDESGRWHVSDIDLSDLSRWGTEEIYKDPGYTPAPLAHDLARTICARLDAITRQPEAEWTPGISQFSLLPTKRLRERTVCKALFLGNTATIFMPFRFSYDNRDFYTDAGWRGQGGSWRIDNEYIETLFLYRHALQRGSLTVLPSTIEYSPRWSDRHKKIELLAELAETRIIASPVPTKVLEAFIHMYKRNQQLIHLPDIRVPWIEGIGVADVLNVRAEEADILDSFQRAYHAALLEQMQNCRTLDFAQLSIQINGDIISPAIRGMERRYKLEIQKHRNLRRVGASVATIPIGGVLISSAVLDSPLIQSLVMAAGPAAAAILAAFGINWINRNSAANSFGDEKFYLLWKIGHPRRGRC